MNWTSAEIFLNRVLLILLVQVCCSFAASELFAQGPPPDRIFGYMDKNKNNRLDPEELERMPPHFREIWEKKFNLKKGIDRDDFLKKAPKMFEEARKKREEEYRRGGYDRGRGGYDRGRGDSGRRGYDRGSSSKKEPVRVTVSLPDTYTDSDANADGQINLKEWRSSGRGSFNIFASVDTNNDGFLTPKELVLAQKNGIEVPKATVSLVATSETGASDDGKTSSTNRQSTYTSRTTVVTKSKPFANAEVSMDSPGAKEGSYYFGLMDQNRDGAIDSKEWNRSKRIRPFFEQAGADLNKPMGKEDFVRIYVQSGAVKRRG